MEQQTVDLDVSAAYDPNFCDTAFWSALAYDVGGQVCNQAADEIYADGDDPMDATVAAYEAIASALTWASDEDYRVGIVRSANSEVISALQQEQPPARPSLASLWKLARELLVASGGVVRLGTPAQLAAADTVAQAQLQQGIISQAQESRSLVQGVEEWARAWEMIEIDLEDMWEAIEAHGLSRERTWLNRNFAGQMHRLLGDLAPIIRAYEDTQPLIMGGAGDDDDHAWVDDTDDRDDDNHDDA